MAIDAKWHAAHVMPKNATEAQRIAWHRAHAVACACRPIPAKLAALIKASAKASAKATPAKPRPRPAAAPKRRTK
jgi:hypothetical protein